MISRTFNDKVFDMQTKQATFGGVNAKFGTFWGTAPLLAEVAWQICFSQSRLSIEGLSRRLIYCMKRSFHDCLQIRLKTLVLPVASVNTPATLLAILSREVFFSSISFPRVPYTLLTASRPTLFRRVLSVALSVCLCGSALHLQA